MRMQAMLFLKELTARGFDAAVFQAALAVGPPELVDETHPFNFMTDEERSTMPANLLLRINDFAASYHAEMWATYPRICHEAPAHTPAEEH